jgi:hypothetical protein
LIEKQQQAQSLLDFQSTITTGGKRLGTDTLKQRQAIVDKVKQLKGRL